MGQQVADCNIVFLQRQIRVYSDNQDRLSAEHRAPIATTATAASGLDRDQCRAVDVTFCSATSTRRLLLLRLHQDVDHSYPLSTEQRRWAHRSWGSSSPNDRRTRPLPPRSARRLQSLHSGLLALWILFHPAPISPYIPESGMILQTLQLPTSLI